METYLVGGAVRDKLLGLPVHERDWVVVGSTPEEMISLGYTPVGRDFPVFLHPHTKEEYALARTERKTGPGYTGFEICAAAGITLEEDLLRRDLTINAMAETADGKIVDPYNGRADLEARVLRHVSPAFSEDPVRVLRIARFAASLAHLGFQVAEATNQLMRGMVADGEVDHLVPERVWAELEKALRTDTPVRFFTVLQHCNALQVLIPEMEIKAGNFGGNTEIALPVLERAAAANREPQIRFAALICDIDNGNPAGLAEIHFKALCNRHRIPNACRELAAMALTHRTAVHSLGSATAPQVLDLLSAVDAFRREQRFNELIAVCAADAYSHDPALQTYTAAERLRQARRIAGEVRIDTAGLDGRVIGKKIRAARIEALENKLSGP